MASQDWLADTETANTAGPWPASSGMRRRGWRPGSRSSTLTRTLCELTLRAVPEAFAWASARRARDGR